MRDIRGDQDPQYLIADLMIDVRFQLLLTAQVFALVGRLMVFNSFCFSLLLRSMP